MERRARRQWAGIGLLLAVAFLVRADGTPQDVARTRYLISAGSGGNPGSGSGPWFQVRELDRAGPQGLTESVPQPSPPAGEAREIVAGPGGGYVIVSTRAATCESAIHRFRLTGAGRVTGVRPVAGGAVRGLVAGVAMSPDGTRIAFATLPCAPPASGRGQPTARATEDPAQRPVLSVLDTVTGRGRDWTSEPATFLGSIVWAADSRTLGYAVGTFTAADQRQRIGAGGVSVYALDTRAAGADVRAGRVILDRSAYDGTVTTALMDPTGRGGFGLMHRTSPPSTVAFSFIEGRPIHVMGVTPDNPRSLSATAVSFGGPPRYACLGGIDAFGRGVGERLQLGGGHSSCSAATDVPH